MKKNRTKSESGKSGSKPREDVRRGGKMSRREANGVSGVRHATRGTMLITAGPTHEPIDSVRFIGNRSSGRLGVELAQSAAKQGWRVRLLLGPLCQPPEAHSRLSVERFRTTADLQGLLSEEFPKCDVLVMAAAVADYRPKIDADALKKANGKLKRDAAGLTIALEATPDLLAGLRGLKRVDQTTVGFALEPAERLEESAKDKLVRKGLDAIVANELRTMESSSIKASVFVRDGRRIDTDGEVSKAKFGPWLLKVIDELRGEEGAGKRK